MAYNLQPLITILEGILDPDQPRWIVDENNSQLQSLLHKAASLQQLLHKSSLTKLDSQIREVAHQAEDILESHMVDHMLSESNCVRFTLSTPDLQQVTRELDSVMEEAEKLMEMEDNKMLREVDSAMEQVKVVYKKMPSSISSNVVVGIDQDLMQLKDRLTGERKKLEIVPIVGMGGVGKTTLARKLYEDPLIIDHFDCRAWTTISQEYNMSQILLSLLNCILGKEEYDQHKEKGSNELKDMLYKRLYGRKYLIVLDDIWSTKLWDAMRVYFPDNNNGSRIVITTRESDVANYASSSSLQHHVQLLGESESWNLLHQLVFGEEECPLVLQEIGRKIAKDCDGLPLAISVIGGLLSKMERSEDVWRKIGDNVIAAISGSDEHCYSILSLSYNHLPNHLKPCFLYMGAFPEDYAIEGSTLIYMWVAEGFVKSNGDRSLEEKAEDWLNSLIERNLFLVREYKKNGKPKSYSMHDMLRDVCIRKCAEDKFLYVNGPNVTFSNSRRVSNGTSAKMDYSDDSVEPISLTRSVICIAKGFKQPPFRVFSSSRLLRVLYFVNIEFSGFPTEIFEFVNLRFLFIIGIFTIPRGISRLRNLQTLIAPVCQFEVPSELWQLSELRKVKVYGLELLKDEEMKYSVMKKLQRISLTKLTEEESSWDDFFRSIPNVKRLPIDDELRRKSKTLYLSHLDKLEILICKRILAVDCPDGSHVRFLVKFPGHIRKLVLDACALTSRVSRTLCALNKLEELTIEACFFFSELRSKEEAEWEVADGEVFCSLQFLSLGSLFFVRWIADETNFPRLRHLYVKDSLQLEEIPSSIGDIPTLQLIDLQDCTESVKASAERIVEEQSENGNEDLKLSISETPNRRPHFQKESDTTSFLSSIGVRETMERASTSRFQKESDAWSFSSSDGVRETVEQASTQSFWARLLTCCIFDTSSSTSAPTAQPEEVDVDSENEDLAASTSTAPPR